MESPKRKLNKVTVGITTQLFCITLRLPTLYCQDDECRNYVEVLLVHVKYKKILKCC